MAVLNSPAPGTVLAVGALNRMVRDILERGLPLLWIRGEVSNFSCAPSGHCYFTLKDASAQVRCTMFRSRARLLDWLPQNGMQVEVRAAATLFEPRGDFQLNIETVRRSGMGALYEAFERLKAHLGAEGLFDAERKRTVPPHPRCIGIVTSPQAAALRDVLTLLAQRMPSLPVIVYPTLVQGAGAGQSIARAIALASRRSECDVLVVCRGGGSIEDLWAFNEEAVARAIRACAIPVVVGVGHETDFTIADFAADVRAPTPSAAAQLISPDRRALRAQVAELERSLRRSLQRGLDARWQATDYLARRLIDPRERLRIEARHLQQLASRLSQAALRSLATGSWACADLSRRLLGARIDLRHGQSRVQRAHLRLETGLRHDLQRREAAVQALGGRLRSMNPHAVLQRGYALATDAAGAVVTDAAAVAVGDLLTVHLARGRVESTVAATTASVATDSAPDVPPA